MGARYGLEELQQGSGDSSYRSEYGNRVRRALQGTDLNRFGCTANTHIGVECVMFGYDEVADLLGHVHPQHVWTRGCYSGDARVAISRQVDSRADRRTVFPGGTVARQS